MKLNKTNPEYENDLIVNVLLHSGYYSFEENEIKKVRIISSSFDNNKEKFVYSVRNIEDDKIFKVFESQIVKI